MQRETIPNLNEFTLPGEITDAYLHDNKLTVMMNPSEKHAAFDKDFKLSLNSYQLFSYIKVTDVTRMPDFALFTVPVYAKVGPSEFCVVAFLVCVSVETKTS
jgi:hypothetical protein